MNYFDMVGKNKDNIVIEFMKIIDNETLKVSYSFSTNLHADFGISDRMYSSWFGTSKRKANRLVSDYKKAVGFKMRLCRVNNDKAFTRLIYSIGK
tara:strand:+ start:87448 stop:87732 length:285 start_codon:yes stop_codon:yes gene_type:complete